MTLHVRWLGSMTPLTQLVLDKIVQYFPCNVLYLEHDTTIHVRFLYIKVSPLQLCIGAMYWT